MPIYGYQCGDCGHRYEVEESMKEHEKTVTRSCPECGGSNVERVLTAAAVHTNRKT